MKPCNCCKHLRTKKLYIPEQAEEVFAVADEQFTHSSRCWCNRTLTEVGYDEQQVSVQACNPSRVCFEE
ncbi:MAG: hypothetical protein ACTHLW_16045 [Verrucomicrobiota bacterium]